MTAVDVAGVGIHPFGRFEDRTITDMGVTAVRSALDEAGVGPGGFQAAFCATAYGGVASGHKVLSRLGMTGMPIVDVEAGCASGGAALMLGAGAIRAGAYDTVLVFGVEKMPKGMIRSSFFEPWQEESGLGATPAYFALRAQRLMQDSGVTKDHLAAVVVKNRRHGVHNPDAMFRSEVDAAAVLASRLVCEPLHLWMLCTPNEGAAAVVLTRAGASTGASGGEAPRRARRRGSASARRYCARTCRDRSSTSRHPCRGSPTSRSRRRARSPPPPPTRRPGSAPRTSTSWNARTPMRHASCSPTKSSGCARPAGRPGLCDDGATVLGGRIPVNPSGGLLSKGEPLGASALGQVVTLVHQLRGDAGHNQVEGARVALAHTVGRGANASVVVLTR